MSRTNRRRTFHAPAVKASPTVKAIPVVSPLGGDASVASVIGSAAAPRLPDIETYWFLVTKHPYVNACVTLIADTIAAEGFDLVTLDGDEAQALSADDDSRIGEVHEFLSVAFPGTTFRAVRRMLTIDLLAFGFSLLRKKRVGKMVVALERLDPRTVRAKLSDDRTKILSYEIRPLKSDSLVAPGEVETVPADDVIFFAQSGGDPVAGFPSPLEALDLTLAVDFAARQFRRAWFQNGGSPSMVVTSPSVDEEDAKKIQSHLEKEKSGSNNAGKIWFLAGDGLKVETIQPAGKSDGDFLKASGLNREDVCGVFKVPVGMLTFSGNAIGSSGKGDDRDFFEQYAVLPLEELIYETITLCLLRDEFEIEDLALVPKRRNRVRFERFDAALNLVKFGGTGNEARRIVNLPPVTDEKYDMDAPLFIGASKDGVVADEPVDPTPSTGLAPTSGEGDAGAEADAASERRKNEVGQKAAGRFRGYGF